MKILPNPQKSENISGSFVLNDNSMMFCDAEFMSQAERLADLVYESCGFFLQFTDVISDAQIIFAKDAQFAREGYVIMINQGVATVTASEASGCFYAVETLRQIFCLDEKQHQIACADCYVEDLPRFEYRGLMVDIARHFFGIDALKQIVDIMSQVKLNVLHLHLTDDQGFRIQIDKYPLLNEISSVRDGSEVVRDGETIIDDIPHSGYLTKQQVKELVDYAAERNVQIVPEIDLPGHFAAALAAYPEFSCTGAVSEVRKRWAASKELLCAGNDAANTFVKDILDEICEMFPCKYVHLGNENTPKDRWCNCKLCRERMSELKIDNFDELQTYLIETFRVHLLQRGKTVICRNDGLTATSDKHIVSQVWTPVKRRSTRKTQSERQIIVSLRGRLHFSRSYKRLSLKRVLRTNPFKGVRKSDRANVLGVEGAIWTQHITTEQELFYQLLPRMDALAECAWGWRGKDFVQRLQNRLARYEKLGISFNGKYSRRAAHTDSDEHNK